MNARARLVSTVYLVVTFVVFVRAQDKSHTDSLDDHLQALLAEHGFTGRIEETLEQRLGRELDPNLAELGRNLFFDPILALRKDNSCAGCHAPQFGFADSQSISIGIANNGVVGKCRLGPRNQRRAPMLLNVAFYPALMWNARFFAPSADPFDNTMGFVFPLPEGVTRFAPGDARFPHLLAAQAHLPPTELVEMAGFAGMAGAADLDRIFYPFDDGLGIPIPEPDENGFRNEPIRDRVLQELEASPDYMRRFAQLFPAVQQGEPISFAMVGMAIAEFEFALTFADAPLDQFARGDRQAMTNAEKRGAILFFGRADCVRCHRVADYAHEMFSDFQNHCLGVPQIAPIFGVETGNVRFDGPQEDEDFGAEQISGQRSDRYKFRTSPLRNIVLQPTFFHNGCFTRLKDAIAHHLDAVASARAYRPRLAGVAGDLQLSKTPPQLVLRHLDPLVAKRLRLTPDEFNDLVEFVATGLLDRRLTPERLLRLIPDELPSGLPLQEFELDD
jgi:cytochrome c peroxidase